MKTKTTYSFWRAFQNCPKACKFRYIDNLYPIRQNENMAFGSLIHNCLAIWHSPKDLFCTDNKHKKVLQYISKNCNNRFEDSKLKQQYHIARVMMNQYINKYSDNEQNDIRFETVSVEEIFKNGKLINPQTNYPSLTFTVSGMVDGLVKINGEYWLIEHKTTSTLGSNYVDRLWWDNQISLYTHFFRTVKNIPIKGVLYNVLCKPSIKQTQGETIDGFAKRKLEAEEKSKSGKTSVKRKIPESDIDYEQRLNKWYDAGPEKPRFLSLRIELSDMQIQSALNDLWHLSQQFLLCKNNNHFPGREDECYTGKYRSTCAYATLCESHEDEALMDLYYEVREPHEELTQPLPF